MTKSAKKKREKTSDFTKRKLKLGKGKRPATNVVDTSFKARSITLPQQSITVTNEKTEPTTKRNLTLDALLTHLKHYSAGVRKDALQGLQELFGEHQVLVEQSLAKLVNCCVRLISDEDPAVRKALNSFLAWLLPRIPREHLLPHTSTLLLFTASALSHIFVEIRIDAIRLLDLLLELISEQVVAGFWSYDTSGRGRLGYGRNLLDGYLGLLNVGTRFSEDGGNVAGASSSVGGQSLTSVTLSSTAKASVMKSFSDFLRHAVEQASQDLSTQDYLSEESIPLWYLSESFTSHEAFISFSKILSLQRSVRRSQSQMRPWSENNEDDYIGSFSLGDGLDSRNAGENLLDVESILAEVGRLDHDEKSVTGGLNSLNSQLLVPLCRTLHPVIVSTFLDCAPSVFSPTQISTEIELELVHALMEIPRCLYGRLLRDICIPWDQKEAARKDLEAFVVHMSIYFPFGENRMFAPDVKSSDVLQQMNLVYCELFSLRAPEYTSSSQEDVQSPATKRRKLNHPKSCNTDSTAMAGQQTERVREYVIHSLRGTASVDNMTSHFLTAQKYIGILPTLWWLLGQGNDDFPEVLKAVLQHATRGSASGVKPVATEFVARLILLQSEFSYKGSFRIGPSISGDLRKSLQDWFYHLPKALWELGDKNASTSELILSVILRLLQRRTWLNNIETFVALCTRFAPFFTIQHATRGELRGPFSRLDVKSSVTSPETSDPNISSGKASALKRLALDVAAVLVSTTDNTFRSAPRKISSRAARGTEDSWCVARLGSDPVSAMGSSASVAEARATLRNAVDKAVSGTMEEAYWLGVSQT